MIIVQLLCFHLPNIYCKSGLRHITSTCCRVRSTSHTKFPICSKSPSCTCSFGVDDHLHLAEFEYGCSWFRFYLGQCAAQSEWSSKIQSSLEARRQSSMIILVISLSYECQSKQIHHSKYNLCVIFILPIRKNISHSHIS